LEIRAVKIGFATVDYSNTRDAEGHPTLGGAGWYRIGLPSRQLRLNGIYTRQFGAVNQRPSGELVLVDWEGNEFDGFDVIVIQRWMEDGVKGLLRARAYGQIVIQDIDDWYPGLDPRNYAWKATHPHHNPRSNREFYQRNIAASSAITVSTPYLKERYQQKFPDKPIAVVRNAIDLERWTPQPLAGEPHLGWVGATGFRSGDLETIGWAVKQFLARHPRARLYHGGHDPRPTATSIEAAMKLPGGARVFTKPMCGIERYPELFEGINIGLVPLSNSPFNLAKSSIKGMEYAASGIPFVAQATPEYEWLHREHGLGLLARKPADWTKHLERLADPAERERIGAEGLVSVAQLDVRQRWSDWIDAYTDLAAQSA
jgi:hypothetical protein